MALVLVPFKFCFTALIVLALPWQTGVDDGEYAAIKTIHRQLDDNADGSVDLSESAEVSCSSMIWQYGNMIWG